VRPECCPRSKLDSAHANAVEKDPNPSVMGYQPGMTVLAVGDGDFTFSLAAARLVCSTSGEADNRGKVIATSYEDEATLQRVYPDFQSTTNNLAQHDVEICYKVDATRLNETFSIADGRKYHRIIWNFPCTAISSGQDGQNSAMDENKELIRKFVSSALPYLHPDGEIMMTHKTKPPYCQWGLEVVALEGLDESGSGKFEYKGRVVFDKCLLKPYTPRKALDRKSFPCHDACVYIFGWKRSHGEFPSTIPEKYGESDSVVPVTKDMIDELRTLHLGLAEMKECQVKKNKRRRRK
jgi:25S rRNA (uracil2634-N3)-methyltransferase